MRLTVEQEVARQPQAQSADLLALDWSELGELVHIATLETVGTCFEAMACFDIDSLQSDFGDAA